MRPIALKSTVLTIMGPTASGKSALAMELRSRGLPIEIINGDATAVYRGFDIGSAKPTSVDQAAVPHHLLDIRDAQTPYTVADFCQDVHRVIEEIFSRGCLPVIVGGSAMYLHAWCTGLSPLPVSCSETRAVLEQQRIALGLGSLYDQLIQCDPITARRLHPNDRQRIIRALEVYAMTGEPLSRLQSRSRPHVPGPKGYSVHHYCLAPESLPDLKPRIRHRLKQMLEQGFEQEVRELLAEQGQDAVSLPAFRSIGYRQMIAYLQQKASWQETLSAIEQATYQLAKRQMTWFKRWPVVLNRFRVDQSQDAADRIFEQLLDPSGQGVLTE